MEVFYNEQWGTICDDGWDLNGANVTCRQLGYKYAIRALKGSVVPDGSGKIWLDEIDCTGSEEDLKSCNHKGWGIHDCEHDEDAGVQCFLTGKFVE